MINQKRCALRPLLQDKESAIKAIEVHSPLSARLVQNSLTEPKAKAFQAVWISSLTSSALACMPDDESHSFLHRVDLVQKVSTLTPSLSIVVDADTGGSESQLCQKVVLLEDAGAHAIVVEDQSYPKINSLKKNVQHKLETKERFGQKLVKAMEVRKSRDFLVFARVESFIAGLGLDDALERAQYYVENKVDGIVIHSKSDDPKDILDFSKAFKAKNKNVPLIAIPTTYNTITATQLHQNGFSMIIYANHLLRSSLQAMNDTIKKIIQYDRTTEIENDLFSVKDVFKIIDETIK